MRSIIIDEIWRFALLGVLAALVGWASKSILSVLLIYVFLYLVWSVFQLYKLLTWIKGGVTSKPPPAIGIWREISSEIEKQSSLSAKVAGKLRISEKRMIQFAQAIEEGLLILKADLRLDIWNEAAAKQLNLQPSDRGQYLSNLIRDPDFLKYLNQKEFDGSIELQSFVNPSNWIMLRAAHFDDGEIALVVTEITVLKNLERLRKEFVANVSHELRTPITVLRGYLETLSESGLIESPMVHKACAQMSDQVKRMQLLADDLIVLSRLEDQPSQVRREKVELAPLLRIILEEAEIVSEGKHDISLECPDGAFLMAQQADLHSAISNLVLNAVRHNPEGARIEIKVDESDDALNIVICDDGVGISAEAIPKLTERFYRADSSRNSKVGGSGLGLAIVKHVVKRYGGELEIKSRLGEGSEFTCSFAH